MEMYKIQVLYDTCHALFSQGRLPNFQQIHYLKSLLGEFPDKHVNYESSAHVLFVFIFFS
jgi:hypothetical protein